MLQMSPCANATWLRIGVSVNFLSAARMPSGVWSRPPAPPDLSHPRPGLRAFFSDPPPPAPFQLSFPRTLTSHPLTFPSMIHKSVSFSPFSHRSKVIASAKPPQAPGPKLALAQRFSIILLHCFILLFFFMAFNAV